MGQEHKIEGHPAGVLGVLGQAQRLRQQVFRPATIAPKGHFVPCEVVQQCPSGSGSADSVACSAV